jgi:high-affinity K+ transport system ATPase subunit B
LVVLTTHVLFGRPVLESLMFSVALAVGLTPELLPMITSVTLARGALRMAKERVIVKRLAAIHDFGSMDVLCTDKTKHAHFGRDHAGKKSRCRWRDRRPRDPARRHFGGARR